MQFRINIEPVLHPKPILRDADFCVVPFKDDLLMHVSDGKEAGLIFWVDGFPHLQFCIQWEDLGQKVTAFLHESADCSRLNEESRSMKMTVELENISGERIPQSQLFQISTGKGLLRISHAYSAGLAIDFCPEPNERGWLFLLSWLEFLQRFLVAVPNDPRKVE